MTTLATRFQLAASELRRLGVSLTIHPGIYAVNFRAGAAPATAYASDDLDDAIEHGRAMAPVAPAPTTRACSRRKWRKPMSSKAARRAFIKRHNRRMRARALKKQHEEG